MKDQNGVELSEQSLNHYANNRFKCFKCKTEQCKLCGETPYHTGYTCEQWENRKNAIKCRYCEEPIENPDPKSSEAFRDICSAEECSEKLKNACFKIKECGHPCCGTHYDQGGNGENKNA